MLPEYKKKTFIGIGLAILITIVIGFMLAVSQFISKGAYSAPKVIYIIPGFPAIYGLCCYAKGKGYHWAWGLLGLLNIIGLIILISFPDRYKSIREAQQQ